MSNKTILFGVLAGAGAVVLLSVPHKETFSDDGFGIFGRVDVKCGSVFGSNTQADFDDFAEGQNYRNTVMMYGEPNIFEGKTATEVCHKTLGDARNSALLAGGVGAVLLIIGVRGNKAKNPGFAPVSPRPVVPAAPSAPKPANVDNPARWASDPFGRFQLRYWNGKKWTEHVVRDGQQTIDPPRPQVASPASSPARSTLPSPALAPPVVASPTIPALSPPSATVTPSPFPFRSSDDHDGHTIQRPVRSAAPGFTLTLSTGATIQARGTVAIGRRPAEVEGVQAVAIDDPLLSKSHLLVGLDANGPWAQDTNSTNGVDVALADGTTRRLTAGVRTSLPTPTRLMFGESWCELVTS